MNEKIVVQNLKGNLHDDVMLLGELYMTGEFEEENTNSIKKDFDEMAKINEKLFYAMQKAYGIKVIFNEEDHYKSAKDMRNKVMETGIMYIFSGNNTHKYLSKRDNLIFRAVHDILGHMVCGCPFSHEGEISAGLEQRKYYPKHLHSLLFSEVGLQTSAFYYNGKDFTGITQRAVRVSSEISEYFEKNYVQDYSKNSVLEPLTKYFA